MPNDGHTNRVTSPLVRQWTLLRTMASRRFGVTVQEMASEMRVHEKTIRRDLTALLSVGFPISETKLERGLKRWRLSVAIGGTELTFAFDEALALYLGRRLLEPLAGTILWEAAQRAFKKIRATLGETALRYLEKMAANMHVTMVGGGDYSRKGEALDDLLRAIEDRKATHIVYQSQRATEAVTYEVHPYGVIYHRGSLYLVAFSCEHNEVRHFKVDRLKEVEVSQFPFRMPADFDLRQHLSKSFGVFHGRGDVRVTVRFSPAVARYIAESKWHASQKLTPQRDGGIVATFQLSSTEEIKRWILSFGRNAVVIEPEELRREMAEELSAVLDCYAASERLSRSHKRSATSTGEGVVKEAP